VVVCDSGNFCLRKIIHIDRSYEVHTIAGSPYEQGLEDGIGIQARMHNPSHAVASNDKKTVYFIDMAPVPAVRSYDIDSHQVNTLYQGENLISPQNICVGENSCLYICDAEAKCVWSLHLDSGYMHKFIIGLHVYLNIVEHASLDHFHISDAFTESAPDAHSPFKWTPKCMIRATHGQYLLSAEINNKIWIMKYTNDSCLSSPYLYTRYNEVSYLVVFIYVYKCANTFVCVCVRRLPITNSSDKRTTII
jgi:hypothetical protein